LLYETELNRSSAENFDEVTVFAAKSTTNPYFGNSCEIQKLSKSLIRAKLLLQLTQKMVKELRTKIGKVIKAFNKPSAKTYRQVSEVEKSIIIVLHIEGKSLRAIGKQIGHHWSTVARVVDRYKAGKSLERLPGTGKARKLSESERRDIVLKVKRDSNITCREIRAEIGREDVCLNTILRPIHEDGELHSCWQIKKPFISKTNQEIRVQWCKDRLKWTSDDWNKILWSDESPFTLRFNGRRRVWRRLNERYEEKALKGSFKHDLKINVWGCFCAQGVGKLSLIEGIMDTKVYTLILDNELRDSVKSLFKRKSFIFQQDNDPKHKAKKTIEYLADNGIKVLPWPPQSPDLNPIENLWSILDKKCRRREPKNARELFEDLQEAWNALEVELLQKLVDSMPRRLQAVIDAKGMPTKY